jgi:hypothetical protein
LFISRSFHLIFSQHSWGEAADSVERENRHEKGLPGFD